MQKLNKNIYDYIFPNPSSSYENFDKNIIQIETKNEKIPCLFLPESKEIKILNPKNQICLYYHGNGEDIGHNIGFLSEIQGTIKLDFLAIEYPGYGTYKASKSIIKIKQNALEIYDYLINEIKFPPKNIFIMGRSLGSGPAVYLASKREIAALIIISGFSSLTKFIHEIFTELKEFEFKSEEEEFNNLKEIVNVQNPICLIHGKKDKLITLEHAQELEEKIIANKQKCFAFYRDLMTHNNFDLKTDIRASIKSFFKQIKIKILKEAACKMF